MNSTPSSSRVLLRAAGTILVVLALHAPLHAAPVFAWVDDKWSVAFAGNVMGNADIVRAFGATGDLDQSVFGSQDELAIARARARAFAPGAAASAEVGFQRKFSLSDWDHMWEVNLHALLSGSLSLTHPGFDEDLGPGAVGAFAVLRLRDRNFNLVHSFIINDGMSEEGTATGPVEDFITVALASGEYYVQGEFTVFAGLTAGPPPVAAVADYFSTGNNLTVGVSARPVPEPGTLLLLGSSLGVLTLTRRARRTSLSVAEFRAGTVPDSSQRSGENAQ